MILVGEQAVKDNLGKVFHKSDGAVVFGAEIMILNFIPEFSSLPQACLLMKPRAWVSRTKIQGRACLNFSIVITANEQAEYMKVLAKALSLIHPEYENQMMHITHGMMRNLLPEK